MNRYAAEGLLQEASDGKSVVVLAENHRRRGEALRELRRVLCDLPESMRDWSDGVTYSQTTSSIRFPSGGVIRVRTVGAEHQLQGLNPDIVFIEPLRDRSVLWTRLNGYLNSAEVRGADLIEA